MATYTLKSDKLTIAASTTGGELKNLTAADGTEFLWQGSPDYWQKQAPNLFPFVGRLIDETYTCEQGNYRLPIHGFLPKTEMECDESLPNRLVFRLQDTPETREMYPYAFLFRLIYSLEGDTLTITYQVENTGDRALHFGLGGHPGFNIPLTAGLAYEDYHFELNGLAAGQTPNRVLLSERCFLQDKTEPYPLETGDRIPLTHNLFDEDALVLQDMGTSITLRSDRGTAMVHVEYPQMPYLGIWSKPRTDAPYVCIEPWASLPASEGPTTVLEEKTDLIHLPAGETYENVWTITCRT